MAMGPSADKTYQEILREYMAQSYTPQVTRYEQHQIHRKWKSLGKTVRNNSIGWKY